MVFITRSKKDITVAQVDRVLRQALFRLESGDQDFQGIQLAPTFAALRQIRIWIRMLFDLLSQIANGTLHRPLASISSRTSADYFGNRVHKGMDALAAEVKAAGLPLVV
jgi:hypothetical protein